jgi:hypothetical protein
LYEYVIKKQASLKRQKKLQQQFSKIAKSITFFGLGNPILSLGINMCVELLAKEEIKHTY